MRSLLNGAPKEVKERMELIKQRCKPCAAGDGKLSYAEVTTLLGELQGWEWVDTTIVLERKFRNYADALHYVNKVSVLAELEGHHPDIEFGWGYARIRLATHSVGGLTQNDFILAAKIDALPKA
jgi:4a-hydroxytetrahydrobiopterin dehydratase